MPLSFRSRPVAERLRVWSGRCVSSKCPPKPKGFGYVAERLRVWSGGCVSLTPSRLVRRVRQLKVSSKAEGLRLRGETYLKLRSVAVLRLFFGSFSLRLRVLAAFSRRLGWLVLITIDPAIRLSASLVYLLKITLIPVHLESDRQAALSEVFFGLLNCIGAKVKNRGGEHCTGFTFL